jgi:Fe-S cluster biogenesis protein NfuA
VGDEREFRERVQEIGRLVAGLDAMADQQARTSARELVRLVMELHGTAIERMMEIIFEQGSAGTEMIEKLGHDRMVSSLLALHGLHPDDLETRVTRALERLEGKLSKQDVEVQLLSAEQASVRIKATTNAHACGSSAATVRATIEEAVYEAAPEIGELIIEGLEPKSAGGFVGLDQLLGSPAPAPVMETKAGD